MLTIDSIVAGGILPLVSGDPSEILVADENVKRLLRFHVQRIALDEHLDDALQVGNERITGREVILKYLRARNGAVFGFLGFFVIRV